MNILFIHDAFPAQFGYIGLELIKRYNYKCDFLFENFSNLPGPTNEILQAFNLYRLPSSKNHLEKCENVCKAIKHNNLHPDLIIAHGTNGAPTLFIKDIPIIIYCEYLSSETDIIVDNIGMIIDGERKYYRPLEIKNNFLKSLDNCVAGYSPLNWTRSLFPKEYQFKIKVCFEGIDTNFWFPGPISEKNGNKIITFVARGLEPLRGYNIFMEVAKSLYKQQNNIGFIVVGNEDIYYYGPLIKETIVDKKDYDLSKFIFAGQVSQEQLLNILRLSDLHLYLSQPYVVSWSLFNAIAVGVPILALDTLPTREIIEDDYFLVENNINLIVKKALEILDNPKSLRHIVKGKYSLDICVPKFKRFLESI